MALVYKPLAEIRLLHEYYLTDSKGNSYFDIDQPNERKTFLDSRFEKNFPSIDQELSYGVPELNNQVLAAHDIHVLPTYFGCRIVTAVKEKKNLDGSKWYTPNQSLPLGIYVLLNIRNQGIDNITNLRLKNNIPSRLFFSNHALTGPKSYPFLSANISEQVAGHLYEQGELASFGPDDTRQYFINDSGFQWKKVKGTAFVNENDKLLVPLKFEYYFAKENIYSATFKLKASNGNVIKTIDFASSISIKKVMLDFTSVNIATVPVVFDVKDLLHSLEVTGNNGFSETVNLIFAGQAMNIRNVWEMLHLSPWVGNSDFALLDNEGFLKTKKDQLGNLVSNPVFEIRIKSKVPFWRYIHNRNKKLKVNDITEEFLIEKNGRLLTREPKTLTLLPGFFKKNRSNDTKVESNEYQFLPNPSRDEILIDESDKLVVNIRVPDSQLFPLA